MGEEIYVKITRDREGEEELVKSTRVSDLVIQTSKCIPKIFLYIDIKESSITFILEFNNWSRVSTRMWVIT